MPIEQPDITPVIESAMAAAGIDEASTNDTPAAETVTLEPAAGDPAAPPAEKTAEQTEEDELKALETELTTAKPELSRGRISVSRHQAVLTRARRQAERQLEEAKAASAAYEAPDFKERLAAIQLAETNADAFVNQVLMNNPNYRAVFDAMFETRLKTHRPAQEDTKPAPVEVVEKPKPDYLYADGTVGYTAEGQEKLLAWQAAELRKEHAAELKALRDELRPITEQHANAQQLNKSMQAKEVEVRNARSRWAGFKEYEKDILAELSKPGNERMGLEEAYDNVVPAKIAAKTAQDSVTQEQLKATLRAELIKEMNEKSAVRTGVTPGNLPAPTNSDAPRDTEDVIRESMRRAGLTAA